MPMIKIQKLIHDYIKRDDEGNAAGTVRAIDGIDLHIEPGQFIAILGHNGSGKSTLAKHLNALLFPTEGTVWVDGYDTKDEKNLWEIRREAGMVFQNPDNQIIAQVVEEDVGFGPENIGVPTQEIWTRVEEGLKTVGMLEHRKKSPNRLSGGQKQRVSIAGVIAMQPKCIILDEPTAMLDPNGRKEVIKAAVKLNREKKITVILITHYMEEAIEADTIFVMETGKVVMRGTPHEIFSQVEKMKELHLSWQMRFWARCRKKKPRRYNRKKTRAEIFSRKHRTKFQTKCRMKFEVKHLRSSAQRTAPIPVIKGSG